MTACITAQMRYWTWLLATLLFLSAPAAAETVALKGIGKGGSIRLTKVDKTDYLSATDLFAALQGKARLDISKQKLEVTLQGHRLEFIIENSFCKVDDQPYQLVHAARLINNDVYLPANKMVYLVSDVLERVLVYDAKRRTITAIGKNFNIVGASVQEKINGDLIEINLTKKLNYEVFVSEGNWINVTIPDGVVDSRNFGLDHKSEKVIGVRAFQFAGSAQVSIQMRQYVGSYHTNYAGDPHRIQISLEGTGLAVEDEDTTGESRHDSYNPIDIIVIDAGHGGEHEGAVGKTGLREKEVTLDIAMRLEELFAKTKRFKTIMTRRDDATVGLEERAKIANDERGDLFISIHANSAEDRAASGSETYFLAAAKNDAARIAEMLENSDFDVDLPLAPRKGKSDLDFILMDVLQTEYLAQSQRFAELIQEQLRQNLSIRSRGVNQAGFRVLNKVEMPSVLVEVAFISNKVEERLLAQEQFRQSAAKAIFDGAIRFIESYEKDVGTSARSQ